LLNHDVVYKIKCLPTFNNIEDEILRSRNRGAIMSNIFEGMYPNFDRTQEMLEEYVKGFTELDKQDAIHSMIRHLQKRGYQVER